MMPRRQYGALNYSEGGVADLYAASGDEAAMSAAADSFNVGKVYVNSTRDVGGVRAGNNGTRPTHNMWYGVLGAILRPVGITGGQTYLSQNAINAVAWAGDVPIDVQPSLVRTAPWLRAALSPARTK